MMIISLLGHHTLILSVCQQGRLLYLSQDVKFLNSMRIWWLTKPFFSHFIYVIPVVEIVNKLFNFLVRLSNQGDARVLYIVVGFVIYSQQNLSRTIYLPLLLLVQYMQSSVHKSCGQQVLNKPLFQSCYQLLQVICEFKLCHVSHRLSSALTRLIRQTLLINAVEVQTQKVVEHNNEISGALRV